MSLYHDSFDFQISCEETFSTDPAELAEVNQLMAATSPDDAAWQGYGEWSEELEERAWSGAVEVETEHGAVLIKPECERIGLHKDCSIYQCKRAVRLEGIDI